MNTLSLQKRIGIFGIGIFTNTVLDHLFDYLLYPAVLIWLGTLWGGIVMTTLSAITCYLSLLFYDWSKRDWLGIETVKGLREKELQSWWGKIINWIFRKGDLGMMIILSIHFDPFIVTAYMRHGQHQYNGMSKRDWRIFFSSLIIGNLYLTTFLSCLITIVKWGWYQLK